MFKNFTKHRLIPAFCLILIYLPGIVSTGMWSDDYPTLIDPESHQIHASRDGRPIYGFILKFFFGFANEVQDLWVIRLLALIGLLLLADLVIQLLNPKRDSPRIILSTIGAFSIVGFQLSIHWATAFFFTWVAYIALLGFIALTRNSWGVKTLGIALLVIAFLSYPILAFFIFPLVFLKWFELNLSTSQLIKSSVWAFLGITVSAVISLLANTFLLRVRNLTFNDRVAVISLADVPNQLVWFLSRPFVLTFRGYSIDSPGGLSVLIGLFAVNLLIFLGLYIKYKSITKSIFTIFVLILFDLVSLVPLFFPNQQQIDMRYVTVGAWLISYMLVSSIFLIVTSFKIQSTSIRKELVAICMIIIFFLSVNFRYFSIIRPIYSETNSFISKELSLCREFQIQNGVFVLPRSSAWPTRPNIGNFSQVTDLASSWVPLNAVKVQLARTSKYENVTPQMGKVDESSSGCIVDLNKYTVNQN